MKPISLILAAGLCAVSSTHTALIAHYKFDEPAAATLAVDELGGTSGAIGASVTTAMTDSGTIWS